MKEIINDVTLAILEEYEENEENYNMQKDGDSHFDRVGGIFSKGYYPEKLVHDGGAAAEDMVDKISYKDIPRNVELVITNACCFDKEQVIEYGLSNGLLGGRERSEHEIAGILNKKAADVKKDIQKFNDEFRKFVSSVKINELENYSERDRFLEKIGKLSKSSLCDPNVRINNGYVDFLKKYIPNVKDEKVQENLTKIYNNCKEKETVKDL